LVIENSHKGPVLVNYWAPWAGPCLKLYPELETLVGEFNGRFILVNINTEEQKELAKEKQVNSLPTVKIYLNAEIVETVHGAFSMAEYRKLITALLPTETDDLIARALQRFGAGEREWALTELAKKALDEPENVKLAVTLGRLLLIDEQHDVSYQVLKNLPDEVQSEAEINALIVHLELNQAASHISSME
jgi:putative thioredoxin